MSVELPGPAYRILTRRLVIRCWGPDDGSKLKAAIDASLEHLRPWLPWAADEPQELDQKIELLRIFRGRFDLSEDFVYGIFDRDEIAVLGGTGLHPRSGPDSLEIGYWIRQDFINQGLATEAAAALTRVAFDVNRVSRVDIRCDPANGRSAAVPRKLGFDHKGTMHTLTQDEDDRPGDIMIWSISAIEYRTSPAAAAEIEAFDVVGRRLI